MPDHAIVLYPCDPLGAVGCVEELWRRHLRIDLVVAGYQMAPLAIGLVLELATCGRRGEFGGFLYEMLRDPIFARAAGIDPSRYRETQELKPVRRIGNPGDSFSGSTSLAGSATRGKRGVWDCLCDLWNYVYRVFEKDAYWEEYEEYITKMIAKALHQVDCPLHPTSTHYEVLSHAMSEQYHMYESPWPELILAGSEWINGTNETVVEPFRFMWLRRDTHEQYFDRLQTWLLSLERNGQTPYQIYPPLSRWHAWTNSKNRNAQGLFTDSLVACSLPPQETRLAKYIQKKFSCGLELHDLCQEARFAGAVDLLVMRGSARGDPRRKAELQEIYDRHTREQHVPNECIFELRALEPNEMTLMSFTSRTISDEMINFKPGNLYSLEKAKTGDIVINLPPEIRKKLGLVLDQDEQEPSGRQVCVFISCKGQDHQALDLDRLRDNGRNTLLKFATSRNEYYELLDNDVKSEIVEKIIFKAAKFAQGARGQLLLIFQGHGVKYRMNPNEDKHDYAFATTDTEKDKDDSALFRAILPKTLREWLIDPRINDIEHVALILDCCKSNRMIWGNSDEGNLAPRIWNRDEIVAAGRNRKSRTLIASGSKPFDGRFLSLLLPKIDAAMDGTIASSLQAAYDGAFKEWKIRYPTAKEIPSVQNENPFDPQIWPRTDTQEFDPPVLSFPLNRAAHE